MDGIRISAFQIVEWYSLFYPDRKVGYQPLAIIQDSTFVGAGGGLETVGGSVRIVNSDIRISNVTFRLLPNSIPPALGTLFMLSGGHQINLDNIILDISEVTPENEFVFIISFKEGRTIVQDVEIICPRSFQLQEKLATQHQLNCDKMCSDTEYSFQNGRGILNGSSPVQKFLEGNNLGSNYLEEQRSLILHKIHPICNACPIGAVCNKYGIKALPGYWGYVTDAGFATMIRCPIGYCCTGSDTCLSVSSCNDERLGILCGNCELNLTESLFSPITVPIGNCSSTVVIVLYTGCALIYALIMLTAGAIKEKVKGALKFILSFLIRWGRSKHEHKETHELEANGSKIEEMEPNSSLKLATRETTQDYGETSSVAYVQILFYFVQDSSLFKVDLPEEQADDETIWIKFLEFTPEAIVRVYKKVSQLCIVSDNVPVIKVLLQSLFGPYILSFLLIVYLVQSAFSRIHRGNTVGRFWGFLRGHLWSKQFLWLFCFRTRKL